MPRDISMYLNTLPKPAEEGQGVALPTEYAQTPFVEAIQGVGGAYFGLATNQNFTYMAAAQSELGFIVDRSPIAHTANELHRILHINISTPDEYIDFWSKPLSEQTSLLSQWTDQDIGALASFLGEYGEKVGITLYFDKQDAAKDQNKHTWLGTQEEYDHVRQMFIDDRVILINGDVQEPAVFQLMGDVAREYGLPFNVLYISNVEDHLGGKIMGAGSGDIHAFWQNLLSLPSGDDAVILRTVRTFANIAMDSTFHYVVQPVSDFRNAAYLHYDVLLTDIGDQISAESPSFTIMPVPAEKRDGFLNSRGWSFP